MPPIEGMITFSSHDPVEGEPPIVHWHFVPLAPFTRTPHTHISAPTPHGDEPS